MASPSDPKPSTKETTEFSDLDMLNFEQSIKDEQAAGSPLVDKLEPIANLAAEYAKGSTIYQQKIKNLEANYDRLRRCRGDGNCFYRAFAFRLFEELTHGPLETYDKLINHLKETYELLLRAGFQSIVVEDFYDVVIDHVNQLKASTKEKKEEQLLSTFQTSDISNSIVVYLRFLTSAYLKLNADDYLPFIMDDPSILQLEVGGNPNNLQPMDHFCNINVEAMGRESDEIHITALTNVLQVAVKVVYLDGHINSSNNVNFHEYPAFGLSQQSLLTNPITLLYRPGHYDILYSK